MEEVKKLSSDQYRQRIEDEGCPNYGAVVRVKAGKVGWREWRCSDASCPASDGWTNVYEDLENTPI